MAKIESNKSPNIADIGEYQMTEPICYKSVQFKAFDLEPSNDEKKEFYITKHFKLRAHQRAIKDKVIDEIYNNGEFNQRGDQIILSKKKIVLMLKEERKKINMLEKLLRRGGGAIVTDSNKLITVYPITEKILL